MRRIALFGGSFDPPHHGHLAVAAAAADHFALDQVLFAPVGRQPFKGQFPASDFVHRYAMTALAVQGDVRFVPSLLDAPGNNDLREPNDARPDYTPNYTVDTLERLRVSLIAASEPIALFTLLGADSWRDIGRWHKSACLLALTDWIVAARPGFSLAGAETALPPTVKAQPIRDGAEGGLELRHADETVTRVWFLPHLHEDISATELRAALVRGQADAALLPAAVRSYIAKTGIYASFARTDSLI